MFYAVPYHILAVIEQRIDEFLEHLEDTPELRKELTQDMVRVFDETGQIPTIKEERQ